MPEIVLAIVIGLVIAQFYIIVKLVNSLRGTNKLLMELRLIFKKSGIYFEPGRKQVVADNSCQYCRFRISYIQITDDSGSDAFYYRCSKRNLEIRLADSCDGFQRDLT